MNTITIIARLVYLYSHTKHSQPIRDGHDYDVIGVRTPCTYTVYVHLIYIRTHQPIRDRHDVVVYVHRVRTPYYIKQIVTINSQNELV